MWNMINSNLGRNNKKSSNSLSHSPKDLNGFFVELGPNTVKHLKSSIPLSEYLDKRISNSLFLTPVAKEEVIKCTSNQSNKHAAGFDGLSDFIVKK